MDSTLMPEASAADLQTFIDASSLFQDIYVIGTLQMGVTVYSQQVRALNLIHALTEQTTPFPQGKRVAIVGGGFAGLTLAAAVALKWPKSKVSLFEQHADLCPLQQASDTRWLHPHIYDWPEPLSRQPSAMLPILHWREGRASDVAAQILARFGSICLSIAKEKGVDISEFIRIFLNVKEIKINQKNREISWVGNETEFSDAFFQKKNSTGQSEIFDIVILATGFGRENSNSSLGHLYWQNDDLSQPRLTDESRTYVVSGAGDGALVDLFRLTIERYRQDRIVYELLGSDLELTERVLYAYLPQKARFKTYWRLFKYLSENPPLDRVIANTLANLRQRLRGDTTVILQIGGTNGTIRSLESALEQKSAILNKFLAFILYKCGAFIPSFTTLDKTAERFAPQPRDIICRHGTDPSATIRELFLKSVTDKKLASLRSRAQSSKPQWPPGYFPNIPGAKL